MKKDFKRWHIEKEAIHYQPESADIYFRERDVWWCRVGVNVGFEQDGKGKSFSRPILVVKKFNPFVLWAIPLSTKIKKNKYYLPCLCSDGETRAAIISQIRLLSAKRLTDKIGFADEKSFHAIKKALKDLL
ncbi:MAG: type II toxin-antitoxin system PemK/MazF family toxin [bacterium]|nr:type II toxin-antitoxin system PemK/MazF family toxin [bacterium]